MLLTPLALDYDKHLSQRSAADFVIWLDLQQNHVLVVHLTQEIEVSLRRKSNKRGDRK